MALQVFFRDLNLASSTDVFLYRAKLQVRFSSGHLSIEQLLQQLAKNPVSKVGHPESLAD